MQNFKRTIIIFVVICLINISAYGADYTLADSIYFTKGSVKGSVTNIEGATLGGIIIRVLHLPDSTIVSGTASDSLGNFSFQNLALGNYLAQSDGLGFGTVRKNFSITSENPSVELSPMRMEMTDLLLSEAVVVGQPPLVTVTDDTVAYNAAALTTPEGAMVEQLIEQIPGAEITDDGVIKINGKEYKKILIDGKEYFGDDPNATLKNLPANIIRRIKTYDRKSEFSRITGIDDGVENNVIDIEIKPNMFRGLVGNVVTAVGNNSRYNDRFNISRFRKNEHLTIVGNMNNVNNPGFGERGNNASNFSTQARAGLTASKSAGITYAKEKKNKYKISGNIRYSYSNSDLHSDRNTETVYSDSLRNNSESTSNSIRRRNELNSNFELEWKPDTLTTIQLRPNFSYNKTDNWSLSNGISNRFHEGIDTIITPINTTHSQSINSSESFNENSSLQIYRRLSKNGRNITLHGDFRYNNSTSDISSRNLSKYFKQPLKNRNYNRHTDGDTYNLRYSFDVGYNEPLFKGSFLQFHYTYSYSRSRSNRYGREILHDIDSLQINEFDMDWSDVPIDTLLSSCNANQYSSHSFKLNLRHTTPKLNLSYGVHMNPRHNETDFVFGQKMASGLVKQNLNNWAPNLHFRYRFSKRNSVELNYNGQSSDPNINELQEIIDKMNPQFIRYGNPELKPSFSHQIRASYNLYGEKSHRSLVSNINYNTVNNSTSNMVLSESSTGIRISKLMNVDGQWNVNGNINFNTPLDSLLRWNFSSMSSISFNNNSNYISTPLSNKQIKNAGVTSSFSDITFEEIDLLKQYARMNNTHALRLRQNFSLNYRKKGFSWRIGAGISYYKLNNSYYKAQERETFDYSANGNLQIELPANFQLSSNINFTSRHGYSDGVRKNISVWNAQLSKRFLPRNAGTLTFQIFDILKQRNNVNRTFNTLSITDTRQQMLRDYFLVSFQYNLNTMGKKFQRQQNRQQGNNNKNINNGNRRNLNNNSQNSNKNRQTFGNSRNGGGRR